MYLTLCSELTLENDSDGKFYVYFMTVKNKKTISTFFPRDYIQYFWNRPKRSVLSKTSVTHPYDQANVGNIPFMEFNIRLLPLILSSQRP